MTEVPLELNKEFIISTERPKDTDTDYCKRVKKTMFKSIITPGNVTLYFPLPPPDPIPIQLPKLPENLIGYRSVTPVTIPSAKFPEKFREAESQDISLLLVGMCIFCYAFVFYMIGWCAEKRKPSSSTHNSNSSCSSSATGTAATTIPSQRDRHSHSACTQPHPQPGIDDCYPELRNGITSFVSFYSAHGINFDDCREQILSTERSFTAARNQYFDRPPRYNDLTDIVIDIDIPEAETPPPSYTQVLANANDHMDIYQLRRM